MVERTTQTQLDEIEAKVLDVVLEKNTIGDSEADQYHIHLEPKNISVKGKSGVFHEWVRLSPKTTQTAVPEGSVVERYIAQIELCLPEAKKMKTISEVFNLMKGKSFLFKRVKLGRAFEGRPAREIWTPVRLVA